MNRLKRFVVKILCNPWVKSNISLGLYFAYNTKSANHLGAITATAYLSLASLYVLVLLLSNILE